jgi:hypothetical protein
MAKVLIGDFTKSYVSSILELDTWHHLLLLNITHRRFVLVMMS